MQLYIFACLGVLAGFFLWRVVQNVWLSPLRSIPGPFLAKITPQWLILVDMAGNRTSTLHQLHKKYGPTVRVGPDEVSCANVEMVKEIYGQQSAFIKAPVYDDMSYPPVGIFCMRDKGEHSQRRRLLSPVFAQANLYNTEPLIKQKIEKLVARIDGGTGKSLDMLALFRMAAFDIIGELFLGQSFGGLDSTQTPQFLTDMDNIFLEAAIKSNFPVIYLAVRYLPFSSLKHFLESKSRHIEHGRSAFNRYVDLYGRDSGRRDLLTKILSEKSMDDPPMTDIQVYTEIGNLVFAGTDTTSTTLTYLFWELTRHRDWQARLHRELVGEKPWVDGVPSYKEVVDLPVLDAVVAEALRLHPAAPASLQREVPAGGRTLNGVYIPEKTVVSMQCYTTQRDPTAFSNPDVFAPERWMAPNEVTDEMKELFMPFSTGSRACLGKTLALMELKMITATLLRRFTVEAAPNTTEDSMTMKDHFLVLPKGGRCDLIFRKAQ